jgi:hypothetical protein
MTVEAKKVYHQLGSWIVDLENGESVTPIKLYSGEMWVGTVNHLGLRVGPGLFIDTDN